PRPAGRRSSARGCSRGKPTGVAGRASPWGYSLAPPGAAWDPGTQAHGVATPAPEPHHAPQHKDDMTPSDRPAHADATSPRGAQEAAEDVVARILARAGTALQVEDAGGSSADGDQ